MESTISAQIATNSSESLERDQFFGLSYWFGTPESAFLNHFSIASLAILSTLLLIAALVLLATILLKTSLTPPQRRFGFKVMWLLLVLGPLGWFFVLSRALGVVFLSARFWWVLWFLAVGAAFYWLYRLYKKLPEAQTAFRTFQLKSRYLPKKRKR